MAEKGKTTEEQKERLVKVKNISGNAVHYSKGIISPFEEKEIPEGDAKRLERRGLVIIIGGSQQLRSSAQ